MTSSPYDPPRRFIGGRDDWVYRHRPLFAASILVVIIAFVIALPEFAHSAAENITQVLPGFADDDMAATTFVAMSGDGMTAAAKSLSGLVIVYTKDDPTGFKPFGEVFTVTTVGETSPIEDFNKRIVLSFDGTLLLARAPCGDLKENAAGACVYTREKQGSGIWTKQAEVGGFGLESMGYQGTSIAMSANGDWIVIGAPKGDLFPSGAIWIFARDASKTGSWSLFDKVITAPAGAEAFGFAVSISPDGFTVAVGAPEEKYATTGVSGAVYLYIRSSTNASSFSLLQRIETNSPISSSLSLATFGNGIALSENGLRCVVTGMEERSSGSLLTVRVVTVTYKRSSVDSPFAVMSTLPRVSRAIKGVYAQFLPLLSSVEMSYDGKTVAAVDLHARANLVMGVFMSEIPNTFGAWRTESTGLMWGGSEHRSALLSGSIAMSADGSQVIFGTFGVDQSRMIGVNGPVVWDTSAMTTTTTSGSSDHDESLLLTSLKSKLSAALEQTAQTN